MSNNQNANELPSIERGELVESRVTVKHDDYDIRPGDTLKVIDFNEQKVVIEPIHMTGSKMVLPRKAVKKSETPDNYLDLDEYERARIGGLGDLYDQPEDILEDLDNLPDTDDIKYE